MKKSYYLFNPGRLSRKDDSLKFVSNPEDGQAVITKYIPIASVGNLYCFGALDANSALYDITENRHAKMLKLCRRYLNWIQNSVFEGEITEVKLKELKLAAKDILDLHSDSLIIFSSRQSKWLDKEVIGQEKNDLDHFI